MREQAREGAIPDNRSGNPRSRHVLPWLVLGILLLGGAGFGGYLLGNPEQKEPYAPVVSDAQGENVQGVTIPVEGMSCSACVARIKKTLAAIQPGNEGVPLPVGPPVASGAYLLKRPLSPGSFFMNASFSS